jgi:hypothetical protein
MALVVGLILGALALLLYVWTPKTGRGILMYLGVLSLFALLIWAVRHFSR